MLIQCSMRMGWKSQLKTSHFLRLFSAAAGAGATSSKNRKCISILFSHVGNPAFPFRHMDTWNEGVYLVYVRCGAVMTRCQGFLCFWSTASTPYCHAVVSYVGNWWINNCQPVNAAPLQIHIPGTEGLMAWITFSNTILLRQHQQGSWSLFVT